MAKQMIKRKDGSTSQRGLWDNIRANKGSGKKPTAQMLKQERKIKAKKAEDGTTVKNSNAMGPSGTTLENVNVRPSRWQTAKHDASYATRALLNHGKNALRSRNIGDKAAGVAFLGALPFVTPQNAAMSAFNVISGQARYNKNKRAGLERGDNLGKFRVSDLSDKMSKSDSLSASKGELPGYKKGGKIVKKNIKRKTNGKR